ncbi:hypothetical protein [Paraburkholderia sp. BR10954]|uniref:hypothetical protein n=1 Tax=Paraburkholderia sp. BR10954 TaxID=3236995 RepID=UPI0034D3230A
MTLELKPHACSRFLTEFRQVVIKGELTGLVRKWLLAIRQDLQERIKKVSYQPDNLLAWKNQLNANVFPQ